MYVDYVLKSYDRQLCGSTQGPAVGHGWRQGWGPGLKEGLHRGSCHQEEPDRSSLGAGGLQGADRPPNRAGRPVVRPSERPQWCGEQ